MISPSSLRISSILAISLLTIAPSSRSADFDANVLSDSVDVAPSDGVCADASGACSLRAAVMEANALPGMDTISLSLSGTYQLSIAGIEENDAATGDLDIRDDLSIIGGGADVTVVDGGRIDRVFHILPPPAGTGIAYFASLTIQHGNAMMSTYFYGGGIKIGDEEVSGNALAILKDVIVRDNRAYNGGGIFNGPGGSLAIISSTIGPGNKANWGGGVYSREQKQVSITNTTISGNAAGAGAGMLMSSATLIGVTIADNRGAENGGGGIFHESVVPGQVVLQNTIIGQNTGDNCLGRVVSRGNNLASDMTCHLNQTSDLPNTAPHLTALGGYGGHTLAHNLAPGSPAASHIPLSGCLAVDQRHVGRPQVPTNSTCDIGSVETAE